MKLQSVARITSGGGPRFGNADPAVRWWALETLAKLGDEGLLWATEAAALIGDEDLQARRAGLRRTFSATRDPCRAY